MKKYWNNIIKFLFPIKNKKHVKLDLVFVIFFAVIIWRVALNLFTSAGYIPLYLDFWNHIPFWFTCIISNIMALFGLALIFRIYTRSLKTVNPTAEDILKQVAQYIPNAKQHPKFKELCKKYDIKIE